MPEINLITDNFKCLYPAGYCQVWCQRDKNHTRGLSRWVSTVWCQYWWRRQPISWTESPSTRDRTFWEQWTEHPFKSSGLLTAACWPCPSQSARWNHNLGHCSQRGTWEPRSLKSLYRALPSWSLLPLAYPHAYYDYYLNILRRTLSHTILYWSGLKLRNNHYRRAFISTVPPEPCWR